MSWKKQLADRLKKFVVSLAEKADRGVTKPEKGRILKRELKTTSTHNAEKAVIPALDSAATEEAVEAPPWPERKSMASSNCGMPTTIVVNIN